MDKGFIHTLEDEKIIEYMKLSTEDKLQWLEEINEFNNMVFSDREKELREKIKGMRNIMDGKNQIIIKQKKRL